MMLGFNGGRIGKTNTVFTGIKSDDPNYSNVSLLLNGNGTSGSDPNYSSVSLLLNGNGTNGSTTFTDSSSYGHTVTANGNAQISTTQSKFGGASMYFDGNGDYLTIPDSDQFEIGSGDFTFEAWIYLTGYSVAYQGQYYVAEIICKDSNTSSTGRGFNFEVRGTSTSWTTLGARLFSSNSTFIATSATTSFDLNTWYHVAAVRNGSSLRLYKDGVDVGGGTNAISVQNTATVVTVGSESPYYISQGYGYHFPGYIDDLRITKGVARYTSNFTPPTAQLPGNTITDSSSYNHTVTANGDAQISTAQSKFGGASMYFDGSGDYLSIPSSASFDFGSGDFTIEFWIYFNNFSSGFKNIINKRSNTSQYRWILFLTSNNSLVVYITSNGSSWDIANNLNFGTVTTGQWYHIALVRNGTEIACYVNGTKSANTATTSSSINFGSENLHVGGDVTASHTDGYIDDLRITKGVARYTSNFTPPTAQLPGAETGTFASGVWTALEQCDAVRRQVWP